MSRLFNKINKAPVRSPSPDIANRNSIVRTSSPINEALIKSRMHRSSKSPLTKGFLDNDQYQAYIKELQQQNQLLNKQNSYLREQNQKFCKENDLLKDITQKQRKQIYRKSESQIHYQPNLATQYDSRILQLTNQCKRIQDLLSRQKQKTQLLQRQASGDKNAFNTQRGSITDRNPLQQPKLKKSISYVQFSLNETLNHLLEQQRAKMELQLSRLNDKIGRLQREQEYLVRILQRKTKYESPFQRGVQKDQYQTNPNTQYNMRSTFSSNIYTQCQNCKKLMLRIKQLQSQIQVNHFRTTPNKQSNKAQFLQKLISIKRVLQNQEVQSSIVHIENNLNDIYAIDQKFQYIISQKNSLIQQLRQKQTQQAIELAAFKKQNGILKVQVSEQIQEIQELKRIIKNESDSQASTFKAQMAVKRSPRISEGDILRRYIEQAIQRIQSLQVEMSKSTSELGDD